MREEMGRTTLGALKATLILAPIAVAIGAVTAIEAAEWRQVTHLVAFFPAASETRPEGFVRIVNNSAEAGAVTIVAVDDAGSASDELTLTLGANGTVGLDAEDLEAGAPDAGLTGSAGTGQGDWRLRLTSDLDIEPQVFARTPDGALWEMHETAPVADGVYRIATFNPGSNANQVGRLRLVNPGDEPAAVTIRGTDDSGASRSPGVRLEIPPGEAESLTAAELESGVASGLEGSLGDGAGKWRLDIESSVPVRVMSLVSSPTGHLTNLSTVPALESGGTHRVPLFPPFSDPYGRQGFARVVNRSDAAGEVRIEAFDDTPRTYEALTLSMGARQTRHFNSQDLELGNADKGLTGSTGAGEGDWRLELTSDLDIEVLSYVRTVGGQGYVTPMHDSAPRESGGLMRYYVPVFHPPKYEGQESRLHLVNLGESEARVGIAGLDDAGAAPPAGDVSLVLGPWETRVVTSEQLEDGGQGLDGRIGSGEGRWRLFVSSQEALQVMSLGYSADGFMANLSRASPPASDVPVVAPDLVVEIPWVSDGAPEAGQAFTLSARVGNRGDGDAGATTLRYYRSANANISASDLEVGNDRVNALSASESSRASLTLNAPEDPGTYYYGACADAVPDESDTTNNCSAGLPITVSEPNAPDLIVSVSVDNDTPDTGGEFELTATVRNVGDGASSSTTLRYYRSSDATITKADTEQGIDAMHALSASESSGASLTLNAPQNPGTYYYGACADVVPDESDTTNNCSAGLPVTVSEPNAPDLVVSVSVDNDTPDAGGEFELTATVRNVGDGASSSTTLRYYRSSDATITKADTEQGIDAMHALSASESSRASLTLNAPEDPGTYYYGACADAVPDESDTTNNCSAGLPITVSEPNAPDLVVSVSVDNDTPDAGGEFELTATVRNVGDGASSSTTLRYYRSSDATITTADTEQGIDAMHALSASESSGASLTLNAPQNPGTYYYGACADVVPDESDTTNNCSAGLPVTVSEPGASNAPDLVVSVSLDNDTPNTGGEFELTATVRNVGDGASSSTTLRYYRSSDATITTADTEQGIDAMHALSASESSGASLTLNAPQNPGTYYYGACADVVPDESDTTNNCSAGLPVTLSEPGASNAPDLVVSVSVDNDTPDAGGEFELTATVRNVGDGASSSTTLRYYRSRDATVSASDIVVGMGPVDALDASGMSTGSIARKVPTIAQTDYYGACVEAVRNESDTTNNCSAAVAITPQRLGPPDLVVVVSAGSDLSELAPGRSLDLDATVTNVGDGPSARTTLRYYWSTDGTITPSDTELATDAVLALPATGRSNQSAAVTAPSEPGAYYFGACVDAVPDESDTTNNCSPALAATVRPPGPPDLHLSIPTSWCRTHPQGDKAFLNVAVLNYGESTSAPSTMRFYLHSGDTSAKWQVATRTVASVPPTFQEYVLQNFDVSVDVPNTLGRYGLVACVDLVEGETETTNNCTENSAFEVVQYDPLDDLDLTIPEGCPLEAEICLSVVKRGHWNVHTRHEEGLVRFNLNGSATLSTDKKYDRVCATVPVNAGSNSMQVDVVPGSGWQKLCPPSGSLTVRGNSAVSSGWYIPLGSSTTSTLNVSLGDAGTCPAKD